MRKRKRNGERKVTERDEKSVGLGWILSMLQCWQLRGTIMDSIVEPHNLKPFSFAPAYLVMWNMP